jgi:hypothetical protein
MDDHPESQDGPSITRVKPVMGGHGLALPPLAPMVGVLCLVLGLAVGFGAAPKTAPAATPASSQAGVPAATPAATPTALTEEPAATMAYLAPGNLVTIGVPGTIPPDGLSLTEALAALQAAGMGDWDSVVAARIARYWEVLPSTEATTEETMDSWVWALTVRAQLIGPCAGVRQVPPSDAPSTSADPSMPTAIQWTACGFRVLQVVILDYQTGAFLGTSEASSY